MSTRTLVVVPTFQEATNIEALLRRVRRAAPDADVLIVDDGSPDGTAGLAESAATELGSISVLRRPGKDGLGAAYRAGFAWGMARGYEVLVEMDADLSHDPDAIPSLVRELERGADLAIGSRYVPGGSTPSWSARRRLLSRAGNAYTRALLGLAVTDATSGFRAYRAAVLDEIDVGASQATGYGFQIELTARVAGSGRRIAEVPIVFRDRTSGTSKMSTRIAVEALALVTWWALRDRVLHLRNHRDARVARVADTHAGARAAV
jgi:dolichol-phosphate mannosyltransferase